MRRTSEHTPSRHCGERADNAASSLLATVKQLQKSLIWGMGGLPLAQSRLQQRRAGTVVGQRTPSRPRPDVQGDPAALGGGFHEGLVLLRGSPGTMLTLTAPQMRRKGTSPNTLLALHHRRERRQRIPLHEGFSQLCRRT
jgi:hypothetical protein